MAKARVRGLFAEVQSRRIKKNWVQVRLRAKGIQLDYKFDLRGDPEALWGLIGVSPEVITSQLTMLMAEEEEAKKEAKDES